jgi:hypothetical protein
LPASTSLSASCVTLIDTMLKSPRATQVIPPFAYSQVIFSISD